MREEACNGEMGVVLSIAQADAIEDDNVLPPTLSKPTISSRSNTLWPHLLSEGGASAAGMLLSLKASIQRSAGPFCSASLKTFIANDIIALPALLSPVLT